MCIIYLRYENTYGTYSDPSKKMKLSLPGHAVKHQRSAGSNQHDISSARPLRVTAPKWYHRSKTTPATTKKSFLTETGTVYEGFRWDSIG